MHAVCYLDDSLYITINLRFDGCMEEILIFVLRDPKKVAKT